MKELEVVHEWTRERATLPVESVGKFIIAVRWGMAGVYELDIRTNRMKARSPAARRKHPHCLWSAVDIDKVRRQHWEHFNPDRAANDEEAYRKHHAELVKIGEGSWLEIAKSKSTSSR